MNYAFLLSSLIGFAPALYLIWYSMRKYDYPYVEGACFDSRKVFFTLAIGMVFGTVIFTMERFLYPLFLWDIVDAGTGEVTGIGFDFVFFLLVFVVGFVLLEDMAKFIVLNFKGYEGRFDTVFYGISFGAGYSATAIVGYIFIEINRVQGMDVNPIDWIGLFLLSAASALIHCSVGGILGNGTGRKLGMRVLPYALVPHIIFNLLLLPWFLGYLWISMAVAIPFSVFIFMGVYNRTIPESLPEEIRREIRRNERRRIQKGDDDMTDDAALGRADDAVVVTADDATVDMTSDEEE